MFYVAALLLQAPLFLPVLHLFNFVGLRIYDGFGEGFDFLMFRIGFAWSCDLDCTLTVDDHPLCECLVLDVTFECGVHLVVIAVFLH